MLCFEFLLLYYWVLIMGKTVGIDFTTICMMWSRVGEDQSVVGLGWDEFEKEIAMEIEVSKPCNCTPAQGCRPWSRPKHSVLVQSQKGRRPKSQSRRPSLCIFRPF